jgi:hypothetical protein
MSSSCTSIEHIILSIFRNLIINDIHPFPYATNRAGNNGTKLLEKTPGVNADYILQQQ